MHSSTAYIQQIARLESRIKELEKEKERKAHEAALVAAGGRRRSRRNAATQVCI